jgi:ParB family chromosome partitioning protein
MDEQNSLGQGINALIPPKNNQSQYPLTDNVDIAEPSEGALEEKISEKLNNTFSDFERSEKQGSKQNEGSYFPQKLTPPLNSIKQDFQEDFQQAHVKEEVISNNISGMQETIPEIIQDEPVVEDKSVSTSYLLEDKVFYIEVDKIKSNPTQPRKVFSDETIKELADSIREHGILEPLVVIREEKETEYGADVEYQLISGERRLLASKMLGLPTVPVIIRKPMDERKKLELALIENIQREDLTPISKAKAFARLIKEFGITQQSLAERIGKSREVIANTLRLLQLSYEAQNALEQGKINEGHARAILLFGNPEKRKLFLQEILSKSLSGRESLELAQHYLQNNLSNNKKETLSRRRNVSLDPEDLEVKEKLEDLLQTPVLIKKKGGQGAIEIKFFSQEDLSKILNRIFPL